MYFAGSNCLTNVDNCIGMCTGSYVDPNTKRCKEMLNDYQCICKAGYTGKTCNVSFYEVAYIYFFLFQHEKKKMWYNCERYNYTTKCKQCEYNQL